MTHLPSTITLCHVCSREPSCVTSPSAQTPTPFSIKNEILGFKKDRSRSKEISFFFHMIFFQLSTSNTKKIICLKSRTCHCCQSLVQTGSIPSMTGVPTLDYAFHICNLFFNYRKILYWNFFTVTSRTLIKYHPLPNLPSRRITKNMQTHLSPGRDVIIESPILAILNIQRNAEGKTKNYFKKSH